MFFQSRVGQSGGDRLRNWPGGMESNGCTLGSALRRPKQLHRRNIQTGGAVQSHFDRASPPQRLKKNCLQFRRVRNVDGAFKVDKARIFPVSEDYAHLGLPSCADPC